MAKIPQGILGGIRGRVGNIVGAAWKGINYIRSMPLSVANPNTVAQQAQRGAFTQCVAAARLLLADLIASYWDPFARAMSGYNHFISINIDSFATAGFTTPASFFASRGILTGVVNLTVVASEAAQTIGYTWDDNTGLGDALADDDAIFIWYNTTQDYWKFSAPGDKFRTTASASPADIDFIEDDVIEAYLFFARPDLEKICDSSYFQETAVA